MYTVSMIIVCGFLTTFIVLGVLLGTGTIEIVRKQDREHQCKHPEALLCGKYGCPDERT